MSPHDTDVATEYLKYVRWAIDSVVTGMDVWEYVQVQNPELNPLVDKPISSFGLRMLAREQKTDREGIYQTLKDEGAFFVFFTRTDCRYCHDMLGPVYDLGKQSGLTVYNLSLDDQCMPSFEDRCITREGAVDEDDPLQALADLSAQVLAIETVPDLFLYLGESDVWIRISTGITTTETMHARIGLFVKGVHAALANGIENKDEFVASTDFRRETMRQVEATGALHLGAAR